MCGIYGYIGNKPACKIILDGLQRLEYRGYDSWGIATLLKEKFHCERRVGYITKGHNTKLALPGNIGIGHVRWATHGTVSEKNAHPHFDCKYEIAIVHNGVIYNESLIRSKLAKSGHTFSSETDTELFAHLLEEKSEQNFIDIIYQSIQEIDAQYSFLILTKKEPDKIYAVRYKSPLKIGIGENGYHVSSDVVSLVGIVNEYVDLEDGDVAEISAEEYKIYNKNGKLVHRETNTVDIPVEMVRKKPPYFLKEVNEQKDIIKDIIDLCVRDFKIDLGIEMDKIKPFEGVILTGAGSSFFASMVGEYYLRRVSKLSHVETILATELEQKYTNNITNLTKNMLLIAITQSGETRDVLDAIEFMRSNGVKTLTLVNRSHAEASKMADLSIYIKAGPELSVIASKTFVAEVLILLLLSIALIPKREITEEIKNIISEIKKLPLFVEEVFKQERKIKQIVRKPQYLEGEELSFYPLSLGINIPVALEAGRKLEEGLYVHATGTTLGASSELKHGPLTMVSGNTLIFIIPNEPEHRRMLINMSEAKARGAKIIAVATTGNEAVKSLADDTIWIPECHELLTPILSIIPLQLLTYYLGEEIKKRNLGRPDLDRPRNLAKSVTVE